MEPKLNVVVGLILLISYIFLQNDDEDMIYIYNAYLHKLITSFLSHPLARDKVSHAHDSP